MKSALILPAALLCLTACKKEEVQPLKKEAAGSSSSSSRSKEEIRAEIARVTVEFEAAKKANRAIPSDSTDSTLIASVQARVDATQMKLITLDRELNGQPAVDASTLRRLMIKQREEWTDAKHREVEEAKKQRNAQSERMARRDEQIKSLSASNVTLSIQNVKLAEAGAPAEEMAAITAKMAANQQAIEKLRDEQAADSPPLPDMDRVNDILSKMPDSVQRRRSRIAALDTMITTNKATLERRTLRRERLKADGESAEILADAQRLIDEVLHETALYEQNKRDEEKALEELERKSAGSPH